MRQVLRVREYERIHLGDRFDAQAGTVTPLQHRALERFDAHYRRTRGVGVFRHGPRSSLIAQNFVGVIQLGPHLVEILPKIEAQQATIRQNLSRMIAATLGLELHTGSATSMDTHDSSILDVFIRLFCEELWTVIRPGLLRRYQRHEEHLPTLRGRLDIGAQIRHNLARQDRLACVYDEFTENNPINRALKAALQILRPLARHAAAGGQVDDLLLCFAEVHDQAPASIQWASLGVDRLASRYRPLLALARLFLLGRCPDVLAGPGEGFALLFDMNDLFEAFVGQQLKRALRNWPVQVTLQGPQRVLAQSLSSGGAFQLRPDVVVSTTDGPLCVLDTKWKRLREDKHREGVTSADAYQMFAYAQRYDVPHVLLLYPHHPELGEWRATRARYGFGTTATTVMVPILSVSTLDLSDLGRVRDDLRCITQSLGLGPGQNAKAEAAAWLA